MLLQLKQQILKKLTTAWPRCLKTWQQWIPHSTENLKAETKVTVTTNVEGITLDKTEGVLTVGNTVTVTATVTPDTTTNASVTWTSSDEAIATVDSEGKVPRPLLQALPQSLRQSDSNPDASAAYAVTVQAKKVSHFHEH